MSRNFDGVDDFVQIGTGTPINNLSQFTYFAWVNPTNEGEGVGGRILDKGGATKNMRLNSGGVVLQVFFSVSAVTRIAISGTLNTGVWQSYAGTWDGGTASTSLRIYKNEAEVSYVSSSDGSGTVSSDSSGLGNLFIGNRQANDRTFNGSIAHVHIYNRVLSLNEIRNIRVAPGSITNGLVGYWPLGGDASPEPDYSGNRLNGTVSEATKSNNPPVGRTRGSRRRNTFVSVGSAYRFLTTPTTEFLEMQSGNARPLYYIESIVSGNTAIIGASYQQNTNWLIDGGLIDRQKPVFPGDRSSIFASDVTLKVDNSTRLWSPKVTGSVFYNNEYLGSTFNYWAGFVGPSGTSLLLQRGSFLLEDLKIDTRKNVAYFRLRDKFKKALDTEIGGNDASGTSTQFVITGVQGSKTAIESLLITGAGLTGGDLSIGVSPQSFDNISLSRQTVAQAVTLMAEASDGYIYTNRRGILQFTANTPLFSGSAVSFSINESNYAQNIFFEETKDDRLSKVTVNYGSGISASFVSLATGISANPLVIDNDTIEGLADAAAIAGRIRDKFSGQHSRIEIPCVWLPSLDLGDRITVTSQNAGLNSATFEIYKIEEEPTRGEMRLFLFTQRGDKSLEDNKFCFFSDPSAADPSGTVFTGGVGETNGWQNFWGFLSRDLETAVNPGFDADGNSNNIINTSVTSSGVGGTGIEIPCLFY